MKELWPWFLTGVEAGKGMPEGQTWMRSKVQLHRGIVTYALQHQTMKSIRSMVRRPHLPELELQCTQTCCRRCVSVKDFQVKRFSTTNIIIPFLFGEN